MAEKRWLRIAARLERVVEATEFVSEAATAAGLDERAVYHCQMAIDETVTNLVEHGHKGGSDSEFIDVGCAIEADAFVITVVDTSPPFNPLSHDEPDPNLPLEDRGEGGWGIYFIKKMMDSVDYEWRNQRNYLIMEKYLPAPVAIEGANEIDEDGLVWRREISPGVWVLRPTGRLDSVNSQPLEQALESELSAGHKCLIVDMTKVNYISSSGLKALVSAWRKAQDLQGEVMIAAMQPRVFEVFEMVGFRRVFNTFDAVEEAIAAIDAGRLEPGCRA